MGFLPNNYKPLGNPGGGYLKLTQGENNIRILGTLDDKAKPVTGIMGLLGWTTTSGDDGKPKRVPTRLRPGDKIPEFDERAKEFWALTAYDIDNEFVGILEITQKSIQAELVSLAEDEVWKDLREFNICINKSGEGLETRYTVMPKPKTDVPERAKELLEATPINIEALFDNGDPFALDGGPAGGEKEVPF